MKCIVAYALYYLLICSQENDFSAWTEFCGTHRNLGFHHVKKNQITYGNILISGTRRSLSLSKLNKLKSSPDIQPEHLTPSEGTEPAV